jgi:hypothetical protein
MNVFRTLAKLLNLKLPDVNMVLMRSVYFIDEINV